jgi:hypothetical protein
MFTIKGADQRRKIVFLKAFSGKELVEADKYGKIFSLSPFIHM